MPYLVTKNATISSGARRWGNTVAFAPNNASLCNVRDGIPQNICACSQSRDEQSHDQCWHGWHMYFAMCVIARAPLQTCNGTRVTGSNDIHMSIYMWSCMARTQLYMHTHFPDTSKATNAMAFKKSALKQGQLFWSWNCAQAANKQWEQMAEWTAAGSRRAPKTYSGSCCSPFQISASIYSIYADFVEFLLMKHGHKVYAKVVVYTS